jgi:hypothetical protein
VLVDRRAIFEELQELRNGYGNQFRHVRSRTWASSRTQRFSSRSATCKAIRILIMRDLAPVHHRDFAARNR